VIGIRSPGEVCLVTGIAGRRRRGVFVIHMALRTGYVGVPSGQRIVRIGCVIEGCGTPANGRVAKSAVVRQSELHMRRIRRVLEIYGVLVAAKAIYRRSFELIADVACFTSQRCVHSGQRVSGVLQVVELRAEPTVHGVAALACGGKAQALVIDHRRQKILLMAGDAFRGKALELTGGGILVALVACHQGMRAHQRKTILVVADRIQCDVPALHRVAALAIGAELSAMNVGMAICAFGADILENHAGMALGAAHLLVHAAQWIAGAVVVELGVGPDRPPTGVGVAILAGNG